MKLSDTHHALTLVVGGTGKTGRRVVDRLLRRGETVRIASRRGTPAFEWNDDSNWDASLEGVSAAYVSYAPDLAIPGAADAIEAFTDRARRMGVKRLVLLSGRGEDEAQVCEGLVQSSGLDWTIVRASWFNQNFSEGGFAEMVTKGAITLPAGRTPEPFVDVDDIADVAVAALTEDGHHEEVYEVTGPRLMTMADVADDLSRAAGRSVEYIDIPHEAFAAELARSDMPEDVAWILDYLFATVLDGRNAHLCDGVQRALGRPPKDFLDFAHDAAAAGAWRTAA